MSETHKLSAHTPHASLSQGKPQREPPVPNGADSKSTRTPGHNVAPELLPPASSFTTMSASSHSSTFFPPSSFQSPPPVETAGSGSKQKGSGIRRVPSRPQPESRPEAPPPGSRRVSLSPAIALTPMQETEPEGKVRQGTGSVRTLRTPVRVTSLARSLLNERTAHLLTAGLADSQRRPGRTTDTKLQLVVVPSPLPNQVASEEEEQTPPPNRQPSAPSTPTLTTTTTTTTPPVPGLDLPQPLSVIIDMPGVPATPGSTVLTVPPRPDAPAEAGADLRQPDPAIRPAQPQPLPRLPQAHLQPAHPNEGAWLASEEMMRVPGVADLVRMCQEDANISVAEGLQPPGYLDRLYELYKSHTPPTILAHDPLRTVMTLSLLVDLNVSPQQLKQALTHGALRDFSAQGAVSEGGYLGSWAAATALVIRLLNEDSSEFSRALFPALMAGIGLCMVLRLQRKGDLFPSWSVPRVFDVKGRPVVAASTRSGFAKSCFAYWGFSIPLLLVALDTHVASTSTDKDALSLKKAWRRLTWNMLSSGLVAVTRYFMFERERVFLNARQAYPNEPAHFQKWVMKGSLEELMSGKHWHESAAMKTALVAPVRYGLSGAEGLARWFGLDAIPDRLESKQVVANRTRLPRQEEYEATMTDYGLDVLSGFVLSATALFVNGLALWISHQPRREAKEWDVAHSILILQMSWGVAVALRDLMSKWNESVVQDTKAVTQRRRERLAAAGGFGNPGASLVAPRVQEARARHAQAHAVPVPNPNQNPNRDPGRDPNRVD